MDSTGCLAGQRDPGPYEVMESLSTHTHTHRHTGCLTPSPQFLLLVRLALQNLIHRSFQADSSKCTIHICLLVSNFHLSKWSVTLEHCPEAEVHGERLYCLVLYLSLGKKFTAPPPFVSTTLQLGRRQQQQQQQNGHQQREKSATATSTGVSGGAAAVSAAGPVFSAPPTTRASRESSGKIGETAHFPLFWLACGSWTDFGCQHVLRQTPHIIVTSEKSSTCFGCSHSQRAFKSNLRNGGWRSQPILKVSQGLF